MDGLATTDAVYIALAFIVPGFVLHTVRQQFITGRVLHGELSLVQYLTYSAINYAIFSAFIYYLALAEIGLWLKAAGWAFVILVGPLILGLISGYAVQKDAVLTFLRRVGMNPVHAVPTAWDWKLSRTPKGAWVLATLKNGSEVAGLFGGGSFASSEPSERDLYIEQLYEIDTNGNWTASDQGVLIMAGEIRTIEFWATD